MALASYLHTMQQWKCYIVVQCVPTLVAECIGSFSMQSCCSATLCCATRSEAEKQEELAEIQATTALGDGKVDDRNSAVVTINGLGIIQGANKLAQQLLG